MSAARCWQETLLAHVHDAFFGTRQCDMLISLFGSPSRSFTIADYCTRFEVSYSTARNDLHSLADLGYLACANGVRSVRHQGGPAFVALASDALRAHRA